MKKNREEKKIVSRDIIILRESRETFKKNVQEETRKGEKDVYRRVKKKRRFYLLLLGACAFDLSPSRTSIAIKLATMYVSTVVRQP